MESTEEILERLLKIASSFDDLDESEDSTLLKEVLDLRSSYSAEIAKLFGAMAQDQRLKDNPEIAQEFGKRFVETRHVVTDLQARWRMQQIEADPRGYLAEIKSVVALSEEVLRWGLTAVKSVG